EDGGGGESERQRKGAAVDGGGGGAGEAQGGPFRRASRIPPARHRHDNDLSWNFRGAASPGAARVDYARRLHAGKVGEIERLRSHASKSARQPQKTAAARNRLDR